MKRTLFVLDYDGTYDNEDREGFGVTPSVYLIPLDKQLEVERAADEASREFHNDESGDLGIGDIFEEILQKAKIEYQFVGDLRLTFGQRQEDYLADYIPRAIV